MNVRIAKITDVDLVILRTFPPTLVVRAMGEATRGPATQVTLEREEYEIPPADGIWDYYLRASLGPLAVITPVEASNSWFGFPQNLMQGVRVHGIGDGVIEKRLDESREEALQPLGRWRLTSFEVEDSIETPIEGTVLTALFSNKGSVGGSGGCNTFIAAYTSEGGSAGRISITDLISTEIHCEGPPPGINAQEQRYFEGLLAAETYLASRSTLRLSWDDGRQALRFRRLLGEDDA